ncbi:MAG: hypothetical protein FWG09_07755, partial [Synergistaceae bacterium]|nr:hypothetical protein [Synergistaceae bacterium]
MENKGIDKIANIWAYAGRNSFLVAVLDAFLIFAGVYLGFALRFTIFIPDIRWGDFLIVGSTFSSCVVLVFLISGNYRILWAQSTIEDYTAYVKQYMLGTLIFILITTLFPIITFYP